MSVRVVLLVVWLAGRLVEAAPFSNLGFDEAVTNRVTGNGGPIPGGVGPAEDLLPDWGFTKGGVAQSTLGLNLSSLALGTATLISADQSDYFGYPVEGAYALYLMGTPGNQEPFALTQRGDVPVDAQWLSYNYRGFPMLVSINGTILPPSFQTPNRSQVFDMTPFRGQTIDLVFTTTGPLMPTQAGATYLDSIAFAVPEPSVLLLAGGGLVVALLAGRWRWF